jgi:hypothetical protein
VGKHGPPATFFALNLQISVLFRPLAMAEGQSGDRSIAIVSAVPRQTERSHTLPHTPRFRVDA